MSLELKMLVYYLRRELPENRCCTTVLDFRCRELVPKENIQDLEVSSVELLLKPSLFILSKT